MEDQIKAINKKLLELEENSSSHFKLIQSILDDYCERMSRLDKNTSINIRQKIEDSARSR